MDWVGAAFNPIYTDVVPQLQSIFEAADPASAEYALANILWVVSFHKVTDYWGPIPYFKAGTPGNAVAYDPQDKIYDDFFKRLTAAVTVLKGKTTEKPYGDFDMMYGGDVDKWIKFANTLTTSPCDENLESRSRTCKNRREAAYTAGVLTDSPGDDAYVKRSEVGQDNNGLLLCLTGMNSG